jgi:hypothetical protein
MSFVEAIADIFADDDIAEAATYLPAGGGSIECRAIRITKGEAIGLGSIMVDRPGTRIDVPTAHVLAAADGDRIQIGAELWRVQRGTPDPLGLVLRLDVEPA